jgi:hypothetical protein
MPSDSRLNRKTPLSSAACSSARSKIAEVYPCSLDSSTRFPYRPPICNSAGRNGPTPARARLPSPSVADGWTPVVISHLQRAASDSNPSSDRTCALLAPLALGPHVDAHPLCLLKPTTTSVLPSFPEALADSGTSAATPPNPSSAAVVDPPPRRLLAVKKIARGTARRRGGPWCLLNSSPRPESTNRARRSCAVAPFRFVVPRAVSAAPEPSMPPKIASLSRVLSPGVSFAQNHTPQREIDACR